MTDPETILREARSILVVDWPTRDLPETLARVGYTVVVQGGPGPEDYMAYDVEDDGAVSRRPTGRPERVDIIHVYRPIEELPGYVELALDLEASTVWILSGLAPDGTRDPAGCWLPADAPDTAGGMVEAAGLVYVDRPSILDAVRAAGVGPATGAPG